MSRVLVAPDSFKGTMSATLVADALALGVEDAGAEAIRCPLADGGEGTMEALSVAVPGVLHHVEATAPDGRTVTAAFLLSCDGRTAVVETASASGLHLIDPTKIDAYTATSRGTGEVVIAAVNQGATTVLLGVGGSGCSDGGEGAINAIEQAGGLRGTRLQILCDVTTTYEAAAVVYGPQKGADPETVERLTTRLNVLASGFRRDPRGISRTGAAGGLSGGLWAQFGADLVSGIDTVLDLHDVAHLLESVDLVITGEGRIDDQSTQGKVLDGLGQAARDHHVPMVAVVGHDESTEEVRRDVGLVAVVEAGTPEQLRAAAHHLTTSWLASAIQPSTVRTRKR